MNIHIVCPFYRKHLARTIIHYYETMNVIWHPVCDSIDIEPFKDNALPWVKPLLCPPLVIGRDQCYRKINDFIDAGDIVDDDYYGFTGDDDMYEPGFMDMLRRQIARIIIVSNYRGDAIPNDGSCPHETRPLVMRTLDDLRAGNIGLSMFFVKGEILKNTRFGTTLGDDDGRYVEMLKTKWPNDIKIIPDWFSFGNYFQSGRHTDPSKFLKPTWRLPEIVL